MCLLQSVSTGLIFAFQGVKESQLQITESSAVWLFQSNVCSLGYDCDVCGLMFVCLLGHFKNGMLGQLFCCLSVFYLFGPSFWCVGMAFEVH
jgi:hypothetical protein